MGRRFAADAAMGGLRRGSGEGAEGVLPTLILARLLALHWEPLQCPRKLGGHRTNPASVEQLASSSCGAEERSMVQRKQGMLLPVVRGLWGGGGGWGACHSCTCWQSTSAL